MASREDNLRTAAAAVLFVSIVAGVIYAAGDWGSDGGAPDSSAPAHVVARGDSERTPLPADVTSLGQLMGLATRGALAWKDDARAVRLYGTEVAADGTFDRSASVVQIVFVSAAASRTQDVQNGWRWSMEKGGYGGEPIWQQPPPRLDGPAARLCDLAPAVGEGAPARFTIDASFAEREGERPVLSLFALEPRRWMVRVDPASCEILGRSTPKTVEELVEGDAGDDDGGAWFSAREASAALNRAIADADGCRRGGGVSGDGTVLVVFDRAGHAESVSFVAGEYAGTETGRCLEGRLKSVRVAPWARGDGKAAARFRW